MAIMKRKTSPAYSDEIIAEVRMHRDAIAKQVGYDLDALFDYIRQHERDSSAEFVSLPPKRRRRSAKNERSSRPRTANPRAAQRRL